MLISGIIVMLILCTMNDSKALNIVNYLSVRYYKTGKGKAKEYLCLYDADSNTRFIIQIYVEFSL